MCFFCVKLTSKQLCTNTGRVVPWFLPWGCSSADLYCLGVPPPVVLLVPVFVVSYHASVTVAAHHCVIWATEAIFSV